MHELTFRTLLFDVDGTLIDSNDAHARTWVSALRAHGVSVEHEQVRRCIGMGSDKLLPTVSDLEAESAEGKAIAADKKRRFEDLLPTLRPTRGARALIEYLRGQSVDLTIATSASDDEMAALLQQAGVDDLFPTRTSKDDAKESKPDPDIVLAAIKKVGADVSTTMMVGDTPYDIEAARRAGVPCVALRCGGYWKDADLKQAVDIFDDPERWLSRLTRRD